MENYGGALDSFCDNGCIEWYFVEKSQKIEIWICLANNQNISLASMEESISYKKIQKAIKDKAIEYDVKLECDVPHFYLEPRIFVKFCLDNDIDVHYSLSRYFDYSYWADLNVWTFDQAVTLLTLTYCPFPNEIISDSMDKEKTYEFARKLWDAVKQGKLGEYPSLPIDPDGCCEVSYDYKTIALSPIKIFKWYAQEIVKDPIVMECIERALTNPLESTGLSNCSYDKHKLFIKIMTRYLVDWTELNHGINPTLYQEEILSLHDATCLALGINPEHYEVPRSLSEKFSLIIEKIKKNYLYDNSLLRFEGDRLPAYPNYIFVNMCKFKECIANNQELSNISEVRDFLKTHSNSSDNALLKQDKLIKSPDKRARTNLNIAIEEIVFAAMTSGDKISTTKVFDTLKEKAKDGIQCITLDGRKSIKWKTNIGEERTMSHNRLAQCVSETRNRFRSAQTKT